MKQTNPSCFPDFFGNETLKRRIASDIRAGVLFHSLLLVGGAGCGKRTLARQIAAALACEARTEESSVLPCGQCPSCHKILSGISADVITIGRDKRETLGVDSVRDFRSDALITSNDLELKVYIIEDVHTMTAQAQNAALKILEEPPKNIFFILLCEDTQNILETILSRVIVFHLEPLQDELLERLILERFPLARELHESNQERFREIIRYARGSLGRAEALLSQKEAAREKSLEEYRLPEKLLNALAHNGNRSEYLELTRSIPEDRTELSAFFSETAMAARDMLAVKKDEHAGLLYYLSRDDALRTAAILPSRRAYRVAQLSLEARDITAKNVNLQLVKSKFIFELRNVFNS